jgi:hypothetical protein
MQPYKKATELRKKSFFKEQLKVVEEKKHKSEIEAIEEKINSIEKSKNKNPIVSDVDAKCLTLKVNPNAIVKIDTRTTWR